MADFLLEMPKAELHVHLEGSVEPETLHELDPATPVEEFRALYRYADFDAFLRAFGAVGKRLRTPEAITRWPRGACWSGSPPRTCRYAEIIVAAGVVLWKNAPFAPIFDAIRRAAAESPVEVRWILDAVRQFGVEPAMRVAELAAERVAQGVVAFGIGGSEERGPAEWFGEVFAVCRRARPAAARRMRGRARPPHRYGPRSRWAPSASATASPRWRIRRCCATCASATFRSRSASPATW